MLDHIVPEGALQLPTIHLGAPSTVGALTLFPVWTDAPIPRTITRVGLAEGAEVSELAEGASVPHLQLDNPSPKPFVLLEGILLGGGWQHRVLVDDVLVPASARVRLDVRCVEAGRWDGTSRFTVGRRRAPLAVRGALHGLDRHGVLHGSADQGVVWDRVHSYETRFGASPTGSLVSALDRAQVRAASLPKPLPAQRGVLIGALGHPVLLELFDHPRNLADQWRPLLQDLLATTSHLPRVPTTGRRARLFVERITTRRLDPTKAAGAGLLGAAFDDLTSTRALLTGNGTLHATTLNLRHELALAA